MINFNVPPFTGRELEYAQQAVRARKISGDGEFTEWCHRWLEQELQVRHALLTTSCTHALEMSALLLGIRPGDEVIMPSYTFVSTANAFVLRGARIVFVDIRKDTMNIDETRIEAAITSRTKAIVAVHYAGVACEMDAIMSVARKHGIAVVEDAAQALMARYHGKSLGSFGDFGAFSFHETKNYSMGEGGALVTNDDDAYYRAEIVREKGTDRSRFFRGQVDKYTWVGTGSSYLPSELNAAYLRAQLELAETINNSRLRTWGIYNEGLAPLAETGVIDVPTIPQGCDHNGHMYYIKVRDHLQRAELISHLKARGIMAVFHYVPLHSSSAGRHFGRFSGADVVTTRESERLLRLPMYYGLKDSDANKVIESVLEFFAPPTARREHIR
ncbi:dTDP-4-amino-4,6-dideoxygalactose transaminase [Xylanimonas ulmi]|uniref:dTDP-4-amino-4,6-dideoxygalactose transaminase n=1 Tax=Xylanimonas ulmi TaxID=228973 RepID=A0A4Q7LZG2_9MICO|nr:dTDP-4-amino-4,6-dideoxygalactose transaminase [Xylanibacterium ulmi]RZS59953.1 dTDP-4-amino-4,6-dideoxygalactose transaminase [Xylanibacterium ulmi]